MERGVVSYRLERARVGSWQLPQKLVKGVAFDHPPTVAGMAMVVTRACRPTTQLPYYGIIRSRPALFVCSCTFCAGETSTQASRRLKDRCRTRLLPQTTVAADCVGDPRQPE